MGFTKEFILDSFKRDSSKLSTKERKSLIKKYRKYNKILSSERRSCPDCGSMKVRILTTVN